MKRAKKVFLIEIERVSYCLNYTCPHCKTIIYDHDLNNRVLRFKCSHCDNEIIVAGIRTNVAGVRK